MEKYGPLFLPPLLQTLYDFWVFFYWLPPEIQISGTCYTINRQFRNVSISDQYQPVYFKILLRSLFNTESFENQTNYMYTKKVVFRSITKKDQGEYQCSATTFDKKIRNEVVNINVLGNWNKFRVYNICINISVLSPRFWASKLQWNTLRWNLYSS